MILAARWSAEKNRLLRARHGIGFEEVVVAFAEGRLLADLAHHDPDRYPGQRIAVAEVAGYAWAVPYVIDAEGRPFLKTLYPSRRLTRDYLGDGT